MNLQEELLEKKRIMLIELEKKRSSNEILWNEFYKMIRTKLREEVQKYPYEDSVEIILDWRSKDKDYVYHDLIRSLIDYGDDSKFLRSFLEFISREGIIVSIDYPRIKCKMLLNHYDINNRRTNTDLLFGHIKNEFSCKYYLSKEKAKKVYTKLMDYDEKLDIPYFLDTCKAYQIDASVKPDSKLLKNFENKEYVNYKLFLKVDEKNVAQWSDLRYILETIVTQTEDKANYILHEPCYNIPSFQNVTYLGGISDKLLATVAGDCIGDYKHLVTINNQIIDMDYCKELLKKGGCSLYLNRTTKVLSIKRKENV